MYIVTDFYDQQFLKKFFPDKPRMSTEMNKQMERDIKTEIDQYLEMQEMNDGISKTLVDTNLKTFAAANKPRLSDIPPVALLALGAAMSDGEKKYGRFNWRETGSTSSVFYDAMMRHLLDWFNGEDFAHDSKVHHLAHVMASCAILLDSELHTCLKDDRGDYGTVVRKPETWKEV
jgi:hypothetical protein